MLFGVRELPSDQEVRCKMAIAAAGNGCGRRSTVSEREGGEENTNTLEGEVRVRVGANGPINKRKWKEHVKAITVAVRIRTVVMLQTANSKQQSKTCSNVGAPDFMLAKMSKEKKLTNFHRRLHQLRTGCFSIICRLRNMTDAYDPGSSAVEPPLKAT